MKAVEVDEDKLRKILRVLYDGWLPALRNCINVGSRFRSRALYELSIGDRWQHKKSITLIGDSAHSMAPFFGKGANAAMRDALDLANNVADCIGNGSNLDSAVKDLEEHMIPRATKVQELTMMHKVHMHAAVAPIGFMAGMMDVMAGMFGQELGSWAIEVDSGEEKHMSYGVVNDDVSWLEAEVKGTVLIIGLSTWGKINLSPTPSSHVS